MKKNYLLFFLLCLILGNTAFSQEAKQRPLPTILQGAQWHWLESSEVYGTDNHWHLCQFTHIYDLSESIIDGKTYYHLSDRLHDVVLFREDLEEGKIYIRYKGGKTHYVDVPDEDLVLFDYHAQVGDTLLLFDEYGLNFVRYQEYPEEAVCAQITDISVQHIAGKDRRVYTLNQKVGPLNQNPLQWIEGIGYNRGFLLSISYGLTGCEKWTFESLCYKSPEGEITHLHPSGLCKIGQYEGVDAPTLQRTLQVTREGETIRVSLADGLEHTLLVYGMNGTILAGPIHFDGSCSFPATDLKKGESILLSIDEIGIVHLL